MDPFRDLNKKITETAESMTKREYFAALALQGFLAGRTGETDNNPNDLVFASILLADLMILKLKEPHE